MVIVLVRPSSNSPFCSLMIAGSRHRAKRSTGGGRESFGRRRQDIETRSESVSSRQRWRKEPEDVLFDSTPLYRPAKKGPDPSHPIKSIEISINKTEDKGKERGRVARNLRDNTPSFKEDMLEDKEGETHFQRPFWP